jgi:ankyrin repeat protein
MTEETLESVMSFISGEFQNETHLFHSMLRTAHRIHPASDSVYQTLVDKLEQNYGFPRPKPLIILQSFHFLDIIKADNVELFKSQWTSFPSLKAAVPQPNGLRALIQKLCGLQIHRTLPLNSVVAFYGAVECLKVLDSANISTTEKQELSIDPLWFAIAGGNVTAIKYLTKQDSVSDVSIAFAVFYHQDEVFDSLMKQIDPQSVQDWLLTACVEANWFYGLQYCIKNGINQNRSQAMTIACKMNYPSIFRLLLLIESKESIDFTAMLPSMIKTADIRNIKFIFRVIGNATISKKIKKECLEEAIRTASIDIVNFIWRPLNIDESLHGSRWNHLAEVIIETKNPQIIQKFLKYGNIFGKKQDVMNWLDSLARNGEIEIMKMIIEGQKDYFKYSPRNPLPYAADVKTARYLLEHGADPDYRNAKGYTLLNLAVKSNNQEMIELLKEFEENEIQNDLQQ